MNSIKTNVVFSGDIWKDLGYENKDKFLDSLGKILSRKKHDNKTMIIKDLRIQIILVN